MSGYATLSAFETDVVKQLQITHAATETLETVDNQSMDPTDKQRMRFEKWQSLPAFRSERAVEVFKTQIPHIWDLVQKASNPEQTLDYFEYFLSGLTSGVQLFSLFERRPDVLKQVIYVTSLSKQLGNALARQVSVLDGLADIGPSAIPSDLVSYSKDLGTRIQTDLDFESILIETRAWKSEEQFKIVYAQLTQQISTNRAEKAFSNLAQACLQICLAQASSEATRRYGDIPGSSVAVIAMGKMGSKQMTCTSDLDIIVIYDGHSDSVSSIKGLDIRTYFQKVTRTLISALSSSMSYGRLYEVDMRLRPSGRAGTVATSLVGFKDYQKNKAWVWEQLALTRARAVAGSPELCHAINAVLKDVLSQTNKKKISKEVSEMRTRISKLEVDRHQSWPVKKPLGGVLDLELLAQSLTLLSNTRNLMPQEQLKSALDLGVITPPEETCLNEALILFGEIEHLKRLLGMEKFNISNLSDAATELFIQTTGIDSLELINKKIEKSLKTNSELIDKLMSKL